MPIGPTWWPIQIIPNVLRDVKSFHKIRVAPNQARDRAAQDSERRLFKKAPSPRDEGVLEANRFRGTGLTFSGLAEYTGRRRRDKWALCMSLMCRWAARRT
jgi:hypothetical protein